ncbi:hypothetical protein BXZ70DRAFT_909752 [Cristinia sonorae]|uniref:F-box domain-containing protein n=1 Tax=Cristinia sonorae TaxID=1940300 RepID=A0A8K0UH56_9AGAR|nr:hypothetical protein BXZ70DRAFT_909752 [Cristinia sonorae]
MSMASLDINMIESLAGPEPEIVPFKTPQSYLAPRAALEAEIDKYYAQVMRLGQQINTCSSLSILPPEVLVEVFRQYAMLYEEEEDNVTGADVWLGGVKPYKWLGITHVCHHWRELALNTPRLWARIPVHAKDKVVKEMVARAKDAPLIVKANLTTNLPLIGRFYDIFNKHIHHVASLDIQLRGFTLSDLFTAGASAPLMHSFTFRDVSGGTANWPAIRGLFSRSLPSMEYVSIRCEMLQWEPAIFLPTLKELKLECARYDPNQAGRGRFINSGGPPRHPTWVEFYDAMQKMPYLRELDLENAFPVDPPNRANSPNEPLHFPSLKDLLIFGNAKECADFLNHVSLPLRCGILVRVTLDPGETVSMVGPAVRRQVEAWDRKPVRLVGTSKDADSDPLRSLTISDIHAHAVLFRAWSFVFTDPANVVRLPHMQQEKLTLSLISDRTPAATLLEGFASSLCGSTLHTLCLEPLDGMSEKVWISVLREMPNLHMLYVSRQSGHRIPAVLSVQVPDGGARKPILPNLKDLLFDGIDFSATLPGEAGVDAEFGTRLRRALDVRKRAGAMVAELIVTNCSNVRKTEMKIIEGLVGLVECESITVTRR